MFLFGDFKAKELGKVGEGDIKSTNVTVRNCSKKVSVEQLYISKKLILMTLKILLNIFSPTQEIYFWLANFDPRNCRRRKAKKGEIVFSSGGAQNSHRTEKEGI